MVSRFLFLVSSYSNTKPETRNQKLKTRNPVRASKSLYWRLCCGAAAVLSVLAFTPLVIPPGRYEPMLAGMPLTLWAGILIAFGLVVLTYIGARVHPDVEDL